MSYEPHIEAFIATLGEAQFATPDNDPAQPILVWGTHEGRRTPFFASPTDLHDYGRDIHARAANGEFGDIAPFEEAVPAVFGGKAYA